MSSTPGSIAQSGSRVRRAAVVTHGKPERIGPALGRLEVLADDHGVELLFPEEEREKHHLASIDGDPKSADLAVVLGGDGTMLRALQTFLGTGVPVIGVNFGRVGFLASMSPEELEDGLGRAFAGDRRMVELVWSIGDEDLGRQPCDGLICSTPSGSTAYNLSNGGPVLVWGLDAMALTFVAPHSLHVRPRPDGDEPDGRRAGRRLDRRPRAHADRRGRPRRGRPRPTADAARDASRAHVLPPLPRHVRLLIHAPA